MTVAVILSGGEGTRLRPLTLNTPKPMLPINGVPLLEYQIRLLKEHGIKDVIFSTGYLHQEIENYFGKDSRETLNRHGVIIRYREDGESPLGTAGALKNCEDLIDTENVLVMNGDILTDINLSRLIEIHKNKLMPITMSMLPVEDAFGFGLLQYGRLSGKVNKFLEKPTEPCSGVINAGIYMMERKVLELIPDGFCMLEEEIFPKFANSNMIQGMLCSENTYWIDIGTHERYRKAQDDFSEKRIII